MINKNGQIVQTAFSNVIDQIMRKVKPSLVIVDPLSAYGAGERLINDNEVALSGVLRTLAERNTCCVLFIHHVGQVAAERKKEGQYAGRGGTAVADNSRMSALFYPVETTDEARHIGLPATIPPEQVYGAMWPL